MAAYKSIMMFMELSAVYFSIDIMIVLRALAVCISLIFESPLPSAAHKSLVMSAFGSLQKYRYVRRAFGRWQQYLDFHRALCTLQQYRDVHRAFGSLQRKPLATSTTHKAFDSFQQNHDCPSVLWQLTRTLLWPVTSFNRIMILHRSFGSLQRHYFSL